MVDKMKLVIDSASNIREYSGIDYEIVPLSIRTNEKEYRDDSELDVLNMVSELEKYKGKSGSACPGTGEYMDAVKGEKEAIIVTLASKLSGSFNAAQTAAGLYMEENADTTVYALDSNSIGPVERLIADRFKKNVDEGKSIDETFDDLNAYSKNHLRIGFCLKSLVNLANNGRISPVVAKFANVVGIRIVGVFSEWGELQPTHKARGDKKSLEAMLENMENDGYKGGKMYIDHCDGLSTALSLRERVLEKHPGAEVTIGETTGLCSFYAERGGIVFGYEI